MSMTDTEYTRWTADALAKTNLTCRHCALPVVENPDTEAWITGCEEYDCPKAPQDAPYWGLHEPNRTA